MLKALRSYITCLRSSKMLGRADSFINAEKKHEAEAMLRESLRLLSRPCVVRHNPAEMSLIVTSTMRLEELAAERGVIGASNSDIADSLNFLKEFGNKNSPIENHEQWLSYFQYRVNQG